MTIPCFFVNLGDLEVFGIFFVDCRHCRTGGNSHGVRLRLLIAAGDWLAGCWFGSIDAVVANCILYILEGRRSHSLSIENQPILLYEEYCKSESARVVGSG